MASHSRARLLGEEWLASQKGFSKEARDGRAAREALADRIAQEVLAMAVVSEKPIHNSDATGCPRYTRLFANADDVGKLTADEVTSLFSAYVLTQHRYGPHHGNLDEAEQTAWIQRLTEGASENPLLVFSLPELAELTCTLAKRAYSCSAILASQLSILPPTLVSLLENWGIGTSSRGWPAVDPSVRSALGLSGETSEPVDEAPPAVLPPIPDEPLTMVEAERLATLLRQDQ